MKINSTTIQNEFAKNTNSTIILLNDAQLQKLLGVSKRQTAEMRSKRVIAYIQEKPRAMVQYSLSDIEQYLERNRIPAICENVKL